jgi:ABC-type glutathione transport system ATPase component
MVKHKDNDLINLSTDPILQVQELTVGYPNPSRFFSSAPKRAIVRNVSFDLWAGQTLALLGPTGAGKSSILLSILRLLKPIQGNITFLGTNLWQAKSRRIRALRPLMQPIFQDPSTALNPTMTIGAAITEGLKLSLQQSPQIEKQLTELLNAVELEADIAHYYPAQLSVGQLQRAIIARALASRPLLLLIDEPFSALDWLTTVQLIGLLKRLQQNFKLGWILVTHDLKIARLLTERALVIHNGRVVESNSISNILTTPLHPFTKQLVQLGTTSET